MNSRKEWCATVQIGKQFSTCFQAQDAVNQARETYETLNTQLHQELPDLHDSRVPLTTGIISTIAIAEKECYAELAEVCSM